VPYKTGIGANHTMNKTPYERDMEIIEAATDGPWIVGHDGPSMPIVHQSNSIKLIGGLAVTNRGMEEEDAEYIAHFNPSYTRQLVTELEELRKRCGELEEFIRMWSYEGELQTYNSRAEFREQSEELLK